MSMNMPVFAIVGRPNVGKSTLFNGLTKSHQALVLNLPGVTRDRQYGQGKLGQNPYLLIDTGGIGQEQEAIDHQMSLQSRLAIEEADGILFVVDGRGGMTSGDEEIAQSLRMQKKPIYLVVNKTDGLDPDIALGDFYPLGFGDPFAISAAHGRGVNQLIEQVLHHHKMPCDTAIPEKLNHIKMALVGRPNVGKSTLANRFLKEDRMVVFDKPGTTRDSVYADFEYLGQSFTLIDTAGMRKKSKITKVLEKFSIVKTLKAISDAHVVVMVMDATTNLCDQDLTILQFVIQSGKALVLGVNKWDHLPSYQKDEVKDKLKRRLSFAQFARLYFISALHGTNVGHLLDAVKEAYQNSKKVLTASSLTQILYELVEVNPPPVNRGRRIKLRYAHCGGHLPPRIVIHGNQTQFLPENYKRYLSKQFVQRLNLIGTPLQLEFKNSNNPFAEKTQQLTQRQIKKKKRLMKFVKSKK